MKTSELHIVLPGNFSSSWIFNWMTYYLVVILTLEFKQFYPLAGLICLPMFAKSLQPVLLNIGHNLYKWFLFTTNQWKGIGTTLWDRSDFCTFPDWHSGWLWLLVALALLWEHFWNMILFILCGKNVRLFKMSNILQNTREHFTLIFNSSKPQNIYNYKSSIEIYPNLCQNIHILQGPEAKFPQ